MMKPVFAELEKDYSGKVKFSVINVDENPQKSAEHQVLSIPTYVFVKEGQEVDRIVGYTPKSAFAAKLDSHLS